MCNKIAKQNIKCDCNWCRCTIKKGSQYKEYQEYNDTLYDDDYEEEMERIYSEDFYCVDNNGYCNDDEFKEKLEKFMKDNDVKFNMCKYCYELGQIVASIDDYGESFPDKVFSDALNMDIIKYDKYDKLYCCPILCKNDEFITIKELLKRKEEYNNG